MVVVDPGGDEPGLAMIVDAGARVRVPRPAARRRPPCRCSCTTRAGHRRRGGASRGPGPSADRPGDRDPRADSRPACGARCTRPTLRAHGLDDGLWMAGDFTARGGRAATESLLARDDRAHGHHLLQRPDGHRGHGHRVRGRPAHPRGRVHRRAGTTSRSRSTSTPRCRPSPSIPSRTDGWRRRCCSRPSRGARSTSRSPRPTRCSGLAHRPDPPLADPRTRRRGRETLLTRTGTAGQSLNRFRSTPRRRPRSGSPGGTEEVHG